MVWKPQHDGGPPDAQQPDPDRLPLHVAIIMDGNSRWAKKRGLPKVLGHRAGAEALRGVVRYFAKIGIPYLTAYTFSTENWKRPKDEVEDLMGLLVEYLYKEVKELNANGVRVRSLGRADVLPPDACRALQTAEAETAANTRLCLNLALNYGGRMEILDAVRALAAQARDGKIDPAEIDESTFAGHLYTAGLPDPDLLIRPAGEYRLSNFLLWQIAYSELWVTPVLWPDFRPEHVRQAILDFQGRERRFGGRNA